MVGLDEIEQENWTLGISRCVLPPIGKDIPPLPEAIADFKATLDRVPEAEAEDALRPETETGVWLQKRWIRKRIHQNGNP